MVLLLGFSKETQLFQETARHTFSVLVQLVDVSYILSRLKGVRFFEAEYYTVENIF